jgi:uncharacterized protein (TIGR00725 family)
MNRETGLMHRPNRIAVIGSGACGPETAEKAERLGELLAERNYEVFCGGLGGVMDAVCRGARSRGGRTIAAIPGPSRHEANEHVEIPVSTGLGQMRNFIVALNGDAVVAVDGGAGTLSEIGHALKMGKKVVALGIWSELPGVIPADTPEQALAEVEKIMDNNK